jgi:hypothetical protein
MDYGAMTVIRAIISIMPTRASKTMKKRPQDPVLLAKSVMEDVIGVKWDRAPLDPPPEREKNPHAVAMSKLGASKGGKARAESLTPKQRSKIAKKAAKARWGKVA